MPEDTKMEAWRNAAIKRIEACETEGQLDTVAEQIKGEIARQAVPDEHVLPVIQAGKETRRALIICAPEPPGIAWGDGWPLSCRQLDDTLERQERLTRLGLLRRDLDEA